MCALFRNKYNIRSIRCRVHDYSSPGSYFITICTQKKICYFGDIVKGKMVLSDIGEIVAEEWLKTPVLRPDMNITLDKYVVMPDHLHAIIVIGKNRYNQWTTTGRDAMHRVSTFGPQSKNLASIIRGFKSAVTIRARIIDGGFAWQPLYHDIIIITGKELTAYRDYIMHNPSRWIS